MMMLLLFCLSVCGDVVVVVVLSLLPQLIDPNKTQTETQTRKMGSEAVDWKSFVAPSTSSSSASHSSQQSSVDGVVSALESLLTKYEADLNFVSRKLDTELATKFTEAGEDRVRAFAVCLCLASMSLSLCFCFRFSLALTVSVFCQLFCLYPCFPLLVPLLSSTPRITYS